MTIVPLLSDVLVIFFSTIVISTPNGQLLVCSTIELKVSHMNLSAMWHIFFLYIYFLGILHFSLVMDIHLSAIRSVTVIPDPLLRR